MLAISGVSRAQLPAGNWQYAWGDDFSGTAVDTAKWNIASPAWTMPNSLSTASAGKVSVGGGALMLDATRTSTSGTTQFSSGSVSTYQKQNFNGGYIEARIWLPNTPGSWPAFWGLYDGWPPEMDIMEYPIDTAAGTGYTQDQYHTAFHYLNSSGGNSAGAGQVNPASAGDLGGAWHIFAANWVEDSSVTFYFDGAQVSSFGSGTDVAEMASMYLILDYAVGGWPGTPNTTEWPLGFTDQTKVDWVRVWRSAAGAINNWAYSGASEDVAWDSAANWSNGVPNLGGVTSTFGTVTPAAQRLDWSGRRTLSVINLTGATRYRIGWPDDRLVLGYGNSGSIVPTINLAAGTTSEQEIYASLEWSGPLAINNDSAQPLLLTGNVIGGDWININGPGVVSFDGNSNTYSGTTVIDSGSPGTGIARARGQNALGLGGLVIIGEQGNATTARLELENGSLVSNNISLNGRTSATDGIVNNSGINTISGTIHCQVGGANHCIQSNAGQLRLTGEATAAGGVALSSSATGTRTFTLKGAGNGVVGGIIENGSAGTMSLVKSGTGAWTLDAANTYTGTTTVSQGELAVNGTTGTGGTNVTSGGLLSGRGTVRNTLTASSGATVRVGGDGLPSAFGAIDDFQTYPAGDIGAIPNTTSNVWTGVFNGTANADIVDNGGNRALAVNGTNAASGWRGAVTDLKNNFSSDFSLANGQTGTYFFRVRRTGTATIDAIFGLSDQSATTTTVPGNDTANPWDEYAVMLSFFGDSTNSMLRAYDTGDNDVNVTSITTNQWVNVWVTVDNAAKNFQVATSSGSNNGTDSGRSYDFGRRTGATVGTNPIVTFGIHESRNVPVEIDDLHFTAGTNLSNPLGTTPSFKGETLTVESGVTLATGATLALDLASGTAHDRLVVGGAFNASGTLRVALEPGTDAPTSGASFDLFDSAGGTINFASHELPVLAEGLKWNTGSITTGVLSVVADPTIYDGWALGYTFPPDQDDASDDVDSDGIANAFEWLFGSNPLVSDSSFLPQSAVRELTAAEYPAAVAGKHYLAMTATVRKIHTGMTLVPQANSSLELLDSSASTNLVASFLVADLGDFEKRTWLYTQPIENAPGGRGFIRLKLISE
jgi:autotransporter-associated beta strand protein